MTSRFITTLEDFFPQLFTHRKVLEVGSKDVNGSVRKRFSDCEYTGVDIQEGAGVDIVGHLSDVSLPDEYFDTVICFNTIEHDRRWRETIRDCCRKVSKGGHFIIFGPSKLSYPEFCQVNNNMPDSMGLEKLSHPLYKNVFRIDRGDYLDLDFFSETLAPWDQAISEKCPLFGSSGLFVKAVSQLYHQCVSNPKFPSTGQSSHTASEISVYLRHNVHHTESKGYYYNPSIGDIFSSLSISGELQKFISYPPYIDFSGGVGVGLVFERLT